MSTTPIFLQGYDPVAELVKWKQEETEWRPSWSVGSWEKSGFQCRLGWQFSTQLASIHKVANFPEAVYLALEEFKKWKESYLAQKPHPPSEPSSGTSAKTPTGKD